MTEYEIIVEWNDSASNIVYEKRKPATTSRGQRRQLSNVVRKYEERYSGYDVMRLTVTALDEQIDLLTSPPIHPIIVLQKQGTPMKRKDMTPQQIAEKREHIQFIKQLNKRETK